MNKVDIDFQKFLISEAPDPTTIDWIREKVFDYENSVNCHECKSTDVEIIVDTGVVVKCKACGQFSSLNVTLDKILSASYNAVKFLQEKKIIEILEAQGKI